MNLKSWSPPPLLLSENHSGFPFPRQTCGSNTSNQVAGEEHTWDLFDTCEIRALFWSNHWDFLVQMSGGTLLPCKAVMKLIYLSFSLSVFFH